MIRLLERLRAAALPAGRLRIASNFGWLMGERGVTLLLSLVVNVWVARYLGPDLFGTFNYVLAFVALFGSFAYLGISGIAVRDLVETPEKRHEILGTVFVLKLFGALTAALAIAVFAWWKVEDPSDRVLIAILSVGMLFESLAIITFWYEARVEGRFKASASITSSVVGAALKCGLVLLHAPLVGFVLATVVQQALNTLLLYRSFLARGESVREWRFDGHRARSLLSRSWPLLFASIGSTIYLKIDVMMLEHMVGSVEVGIYAVAARLSEVWYFIPTALAGSLFPSIIAYRKLSPEQYQARMQRVYRIMVIASLGIAVPVTLLARPLISILYGAEYGASASILMIHIWTCPAVFMGAVLARWIISENLYMISLTRQAAAAIANVVLNLFLIPRYGAIGAAVATLLSYTVGSYLFCFTDRRTFTTGVMMTRALIMPFKDVLSVPTPPSRIVAGALEDQKAR